MQYLYKIAILFLVPLLWPFPVTSKNPVCNGVFDLYFVLDRYVKKNRSLCLDVSVELVVTTFRVSDVMRYEYLEY